MSQSSPRADVLRLRLRSSARHFARHRAQLALALVGVATGVAAVVAVGLARHSVQAAFEASFALLSGGTTHRIVGTDGRISLAHYAALRRAHGDIPMAPRLRLGVTGPDGERWTLAGVDPMKEAAFGRPGAQATRTPDDRDGTSRTRFPTAAWFAGEALVLLPAGRAAAGDSFRFELNGTMHAATVAGTFGSTAPGSTRVAVADLTAVQRWAGAGEAIDAIDVMTDETGARALGDALPAGLRLEAVDRGERGLTRAFDLNLTALSLLTALVGAFIVFNTFSFLVLQRRDLFELEYRLGITRRAQRRQVLAEALTTGVVGSLVGLAAGIALGTVTLAVTRRTVSNLYYDVGAATLEIDPTVLAAGFAVGVVSCLLAALQPARRLDGTAPAAKAPWLIPALTVLLAAGLALLLLPTGLLGALAGVFLAALGYAALGAPLLARLLDGWIRRVPFSRRAVLGLSLRRLPRSLDRMLPAATALTLAVATVIGVGTMIGSFRSTVSDWLERSLTADFYVAADRHPLTPAFVAAAAEAPGVARIARFKAWPAKVDGVETELAVAEFTPEQRASFRFLSGSAAEAFGAERLTFLLSEGLARSLGVTAGDRLRVATTPGELAGRVGGVVTDYRTGKGRITVAWDAYVRAHDPPPVGSLGLYLEPGAPVEPLAERLSALAAGRDDVRLADTGSILEQSMAVFDQTFEVTRALQWIAAIVALVGLTGSLMALQLDRRAELRLLDALGVGSAERRRSLRFEALLIGTVVGIFALPLGALLAWALTAVINLRAFGWTLVPQPVTGAALLGLGVALAGAWLAGTIAARSERPA